MDRGQYRTYALQITRSEPSPRKTLVSSSLTTHICPIPPTNLPHFSHGLESSPQTSASIFLTTASAPPFPSLTSTLKHFRLSLSSCPSASFSSLALSPHRINLTSISFGTAPLNLLSGIVVSGSARIAIPVCRVSFRASCASLY